MKIKNGDKVKIIAGKDKGKVGKVVKVYAEEAKVVVEGVNIVKKHIKARKTGEKGGIVSVERPVHVSNVLFFDDKIGKTTRIGYRLVEGKKYRISKATGDVIDK